ncbi:MAG: hypothetical protein ACM31C_04155 [Acidobacteriota bacterium]
MQLGTVLPGTPPPRDENAVRSIARKYAPWWGYVAYGILYAFLACTVGAVLIGIVFEYLRPSWAEDPFDLAHWTICWTLALGLVTPPFVWWVVHHRHRIHELARHGAILRGRVVKSRRSGLAAALLRLGPRARSSKLVVACERGVYRVTVGGEHPWWGAAGTELDLVVAPLSRHAIAISPDGEDFAAKRV